jgi:peptide-methionine (S)-S-oxide reductase
MRNFIYTIFTCLSLSCQAQPKNDKRILKEENIKSKLETGMETITLGAGCFWCVEAVFQNLKGVVSVTSGYMGGAVNKPTYKEVCTGSTGHAEVAQLVYDKSQIRLEEILEAFFLTHDPTTLNRQGNDFGTQYRSAIFYHTEEQKLISESIITELNQSGAYPDKIVTEVTKEKEFFKAEDYHQNYFNDNKTQGYCQFVIQPKVDKFRKVFKDKLK